MHNDAAVDRHAAASHRYDATWLRGAQSSSPFASPYVVPTIGSDVTIAVNGSGRLRTEATQADAPAHDDLEHGPDGRRRKQALTTLLQNMEIA
jgi:hypothetical protein